MDAFEEKTRILVQKQFSEEILKVLLNSWKS